MLKWRTISTTLCRLIILLTKLPEHKLHGGLPLFIYEIVPTLGDEVCKHSGIKSHSFVSGVYNTGKNFFKRKEPHHQ